jgi:hypothetical protein
MKKTEKMENGDHVRDATKRMPRGYASAASGFTGADEADYKGGFYDTAENYTGTYPMLEISDGKGGKLKMKITKIDVGKRVQFAGDPVLGTVVFESYPLWQGQSKPCLHIRWDDHQRTLLSDDLAMEQISLVREDA